SMTDGFLEGLSKAFKLSMPERIGIGLALFDSENSSSRMRGQNFCIAQIEQLCANPTSTLSNEKIQDIVMFLYRSEGLSKHMDSFTNILSLLELKESSLFLPAPWMKNDTQPVNPLRHLDLFFGCQDNDFESLLAEIEEEISMADIMAELGYGCTVNASHCKDMLSLFQPLNETTISKLLGAIARTHSGLEDAHNTYATFCSAVCSSSVSDSSLLNAWNVDVLIDSINQLAPKINWTHVMQNLDHEGFNIPDEAAFSNLMSIYTRACQDPFPLHAVCGSVWKNAEGQLSFLRYAVSAPPNLFTFGHCSRQLAYGDFAYLRNKQGNQAWFCLDLLEVLCHLAERGHASSVRAILEYPLTHCPEVLMVGIGHINTAYNLLQYEVSSRVFPMLLKDSTKNSIIDDLWGVNPSLVLRGFLDAHTDPDCLPRILDACQELKILSTVLDATPFPFSIKLASIASRKEHINLEKWLSEKLSAHKNVFFEECVNFLKEVLSDVTNDVTESSQQSRSLLNYYQETCSIFFKVLQAHSGQFIANPHLEELKRLHLVSSPTNVGAMATDVATPDGSSDDIEVEANNYFHQMFSGQLSIEAIVQMLARFKESSDKREVKIFNCMIANLFEEYKFFPKYPDKQLKLAAVLFGSLIKHQLVTHLALGIALRGVLDALRKSVDSKMFMFGTKALEQFLDRLVEWPQYCNHILQISHLRGTHADLVSAIERALARVSSSQAEANGGNPLPAEQQSSGPASIESIDATASQSPQAPSHHSVTVPTAVSSSPVFPRSRSFATTGMPRQTSYGTGFGAALNIETLVAAAEQRDTPLEAPSSDIQDKILFMINNISTANMEAKAKEFTEVLKEQYYPWFAQYMVMKRASIEPNFHDLYLKFLDKVNSKALNKEIVKATYENCKVLLRSDLIKTSSEERSLLKNLGSWLGKFTIGRNQALRAKEIDLKVLIIEAYEKGLMIAVIPFTSKILEPCQSSIAYQPPNPWTMGILSLLTEIYNLPNLKMNLKFDIEYTTIHLASNTMGEEDKVGPLIIPEHVPSAQGLTQVTPSPSPSPSASPSPSPSPFSLSQLLTIIPDSDSYINVNPKLSSMGSQSQFHRIIQLAMDRAIREIVAPVIQRSVTIASRTTKELILKDFAMELDDSTIAHSAHVMVGTLAGSLAHVTCKEPLRVSLSNHLRSLLQALNSNNENIEQIVQIITNDHLDLGCAMIENAASEKAVELIDGIIGQAFSALRKQREAAGAAYYDAITYTQGAFTRVPEALRPKPGRLTPAQQRVYDDFKNIWQNQSSQNASTGSTGPPVMGGGSVNSGLPRVYSTAAPSSTSSISTSQVAPFSSVSQPLDLITDVSDRGSMQLLSTTSQTGTNDTPFQQGGGISSIVSPIPSAVISSDLPAADTTTLTKEFGTVVPSSPTTTADRLGTTVLPEAMLTTGEALEKYQQVSQKMETLIANDARETEIQVVVAEVPDIIRKSVSRDEAALAVAQKVFKSLYENASNALHISSHLAVLASIRDVCKLVVKELTSWVIYSDEERKFNKEITVGLIRSELLNLAEYNVHLAKLIDGGRNKAATEFAISLVQTLVAQEPGVSMSELYNLIDALAKLAMRPGSPESLQQLIEIARKAAPNSNANKDEKARQSRDKKALSGRSLTSKEEYNDSATADSAGFQDQVAILFSEWCQICDHPTTNDATYSHYISQLNQSSLLKGDDITDRFFRIFMELAVSHSLVAEQVMTPSVISLHSAQQLQQVSYFSIDSYAKLVVLILKYSSVDQGSVKAILLPKILSVTVRVIQKDAEEKKLSFNPKPYFRLFINWLLDLASPDPLLDGSNFQVLTSFANAFHALQPLKVPAWSFCDVIPSTCIQMRNVILSAFPRNMRLPDPSTPNLKIDLLAEITQSPRILSDVDGALKAKQIKTEIDDYLKTRPEGSPFLTELKQRVLLPQSEANVAGTRYNIPLINSLVLYVGMQSSQAIQQLQSKSTPQHVPAQQMSHNPPMDIFLVGAAMDIFQSLIKNLDTEGRYLFLNAVANQLRYPNNHTHYFSFVLLYLFAEASQEIIQEQITRVLLERLIVNRPHPWGLLITFIELIKNPRYNFWNRSFTRCAPEIEKLFESVSRSCGGPKAVDDGILSSSVSDGNH
ncbi:CCR4-NOT transcription complex subunit 1, partial [Ananas comosus]